MRDNILLYVKSEKVYLSKYSKGPIVHTGWWVDGYCTPPGLTQATRNYKAEDQEAVNLLKEAAFAYKLVDLSDCSLLARLKAKMGGVDETPILFLNHKKIKGIGNIKQVLQGIKPKRNSA